MARVKVHLLGEVRVYKDKKLVALLTRKLQALLGYLITHRERAHSRQRLMGLFWGESPEEKARDSLNNAISMLRRALGRDILLTRPGSVGFNTRSDYWLDVEAFERLIAKAKRLDSQDAARAHALEEAVALYGGDFLEGFYDDWVIFEQERLQSIYLETSKELMLWHKNRKAYAQAIECGRRLLARQKFSEEVHRELMALYVLSSDREAALRQYHTCCKILKEELNTEPLPETRQLYEKLRQQRVLAPQELVAVELKYPEILAPFVGRVRELQLLLNHWRVAEQGRGHFVLINGEAGVGKSRLAQELMNHVSARGGLILSGSCYAFDEAMPYQSLVDALRGYLQKASVKPLQRLSGCWLAELAKLVPEILENQPRLKERVLSSAVAEKSRLFEALTQLLSAIARQRPLLLFLDDLHWADRATLEYVNHLARRICERRILLLGTYRTEEINEKHPLLELISQLGLRELLTRVSLSPLSQEELTHLIAQMLGGEQAELCELMYRETEGNPFFAVALIKSLIEAGALAQDKRGHWRLQVTEITPDLLPQGVRELVQTRLRRVSPAGRQLLDVAAVRGKAFEFSLLQQLISRQEEALLDLIDDLLRAALIVETENSRYAFSHELIRQVVYGGLSARRRRYLHLQVAQALEALYADRLEELSGELAYHFEQAQAWPEALKYLLQAGERAKRAYANHEALDLFGRALTRIDQLLATRKLRQRTKERLLRERFEALKARVEIHQILGRLSEQEQEVSEMFALVTKLKDSKYRAEAHRQKAEFLRMADRDTEAKAEAQRALALERRSGDRRGEGRTLLQLGLVHESLGEYKQALKCYQQAYERQRRDKAGRATASMRMATMFWFLGDVQKALASYHKPCEIYRELNDLLGVSDALNNMAIIYEDVGQSEKALECYKQALELRRQIGDRRREAATLNNIGSLHWNSGRLSEALGHFEKALGLWRQIDYKKGEAATLGNLGTVHCERGEYVKALARLEEALQIARRLGLRGLEIESLMRLSQAYLGLGRYQEAEKHSAQAMALLEAGANLQNKPLAYWYHFRVLNATNRREEASTYLQKAYKELMAEANKLKDRALRESFLTKVKTNREILQAWGSLQPRQ